MKMLLIVALALLALPLVAEAQTCPKVTILMTDSDVIAEGLRFPILVPMTLVPIKPCPNGTAQEAIANLGEQIRSGVILAQDGVAGQVVGIPPARVVRYTLD